MKENYSERIMKNVRRQGVVICGMIIIRNELKGVPRSPIIKFIGTTDREFLKTTLLNFYDKLVHKNLDVGEAGKGLAKEYYDKYTELKGNHKWKTVKNDFIIVAVATLNKMNIIASLDGRTMMKKEALEAYKEINKKYGLRTPKFITLNDFMNELSR